MNSAAYNYWKAIKQLTTNVGSVFQAPPYTIRGNIGNVNNPRELVVGYFEVSGQDLIRKNIDRGNIPTSIQSCDLFSVDYNINFSYCHNCLIIAGSTITEPNWFW
jgi:hypothetical protein